MTSPLNFRAERDKSSTSWERADPARALIEHVSRYGYVVTLPGGSTHRVAYARENGAYIGRCDCKGWEYRDDEMSPCAHLCTLRQAEWSATNLGSDPAALDVNGEPIVAQRVEDEGGPDFEQHENADRAIADGGDVELPAAGSDGRMFGRPEEQL